MENTSICMRSNPSSDHCSRSASSCPMRAAREEGEPQARPRECRRLAGGGAELLVHDRAMVGLVHLERLRLPPTHGDLLAVDLHGAPLAAVLVLGRAAVRRLAEALHVEVL